MKKTNLFKGLATTFGSLAAVCLFMTTLAWSRAGDINLYLGVNKKDESDVSASGAYPSKYENKAKMLEAESEYTIQCEEEGSVLLKNNGALPFASSVQNVTLFGSAAYTPAYHGGSGGPANTGTSLKSALTTAGYKVNETVYNKIGEAYKTLTSTKNHRCDGHIGEVPASTYSAGDMEGYKDAAIVVLCRFGGEANDMNTVDADGERELALHPVEKDMLNFVKSQGFGKIIVLLNTGYAMEIGWLDEYNVDACMWIGYPGESGMTGVANMLKGTSSPTGRLVDTYAEHSFSSAAMQNFGDFNFVDLQSAGIGQYHKEYVVYAEGIYVGYKYYESRYEDLVFKRRNADGNFGCFASTGGKWSYDAEVTYPFGYGLTYTDFQEEVQDITWDREEKKVTATVKVTNVGTSYQGKVKDTVELYAALPWEEGQAEKSAIQLVGFAKTEALAPGENATVTIEIEDYLLATYDENATNGADSSKKGCYTFDKGDYTLAIGKNAHDALNNVIAFRDGASYELTDGNGNKVSGNPSMARKFTVDALDNTTHAKSYTGTVVSNQFPEVDINNYEENEVTYMTRGDWSTFPKTYDNLTTEKDASGFIKTNMVNKDDPYQKPADAPTSGFKFHKDEAEAELKFYEMANVEYDDPKWEKFIDQLTVADLYAIPGEKMANDAIPFVGYPQNTSGDGPDGLQSGGKLHVSQTLACATWNVELIKARGEFLAEDGLWNSLNCVYGGGCNLHRTPYAGRNFEYYSEDSNMSYIMGMNQASAMAKKGMISCFKHFCGNDQETNRHGVATFMTEQTLRHGDLRGFEGALGKGGSLGNMSAYNRLGVMPTASYKALMTTVLRDEWGFKGISMTDSSKDAQTYIFTGAAIDAGTDQFNNDAGRCTEIKNYIVSQRDYYIWKQCRSIAKHFFYAYSRSFLINGLSADTVVTQSTPWWKTAIISADVTIGVIAVGSLAGYVVFKFVKKEGN